MAVTKVLSRHMRPDQLISYVANPMKTEEHTLVSCFHCELDTAARQMLETKARWGKEGGIEMFHGIQSFDPGEVSPELAHDIGRQFIEEHFMGYEVVLATHIDKDHIHNHMAVNSVSFLTGKKYHSTAESYYVQVRGTSDRLCRENGLSVIENPGRHGKSYALWRANKLGYPTLREMLDKDAEEVLAIALSAGDVYRLMEARGYEVEHNSKYPTFKPKGAEHGFRLKHDGKSLTEDDIDRLIENDLMDTTHETFVIKERERIPFVPFKKLHGFRALVAHYMYILGMFAERKQVPYKVKPEDLKLFRRLQEELIFLGKYEIDSDDALNDREAAIEAEMDKLTKTRTILNSKKKRNKKLYDALADAEYYAGVPEDYAEEHARLFEAQCLLEGRDMTALNKEKTELYEKLVEVNKRLRELRSEKRIIANTRVDMLHITEVLDDPAVNRQEAMRELMEER